MYELVDITDVKVLRDQRLRLAFADGVVSDVAFDREQWTGVLAPLAAPDFLDGPRRGRRQPLTIAKLSLAGADRAPVEPIAVMTSV